MNHSQREPAKPRHPALTGAVDAASLAVFRMAFGLLMFFESLAYLFKGWVRELDRLPKIISETRTKDWYDRLNRSSWAHLPSTSAARS